MAFRPISSLIKFQKEKRRKNRKKEEEAVQPQINGLVL